MSEYSPKTDPQTVIRYTIAEPAQPGTRNQEELDPMIDIDDIIKNGQPVSRMEFGRLKPRYERDIIEFLRGM